LEDWFPLVFELLLFPLVFVVLNNSLSNVRVNLGVVTGFTAAFLFLLASFSLLLDVLLSSSIDLLISKDLLATEALLISSSSIDVVVLIFLLFLLPFGRP
jgi:hypothetical protein